MKVFSTESDFCNSAGATLPILLLAVHIFLRILQEFLDNFLKKHLRTATT